MPNSLTCRFDCEGPPIEPWKRPGEFLIRSLVARLSRQDRIFGECDLWRDSGWEVDCRTPEGEVSVVVLELRRKDDWILQIAATRRPLLLGRLFGRKPSADARLIHALTTEIHDLMIADGRFDNLRWAWDDLPNRSVAPGPPTIA